MNPAVFAVVPGTLTNERTRSNIRHHVPDEFARSCRALDLSNATKVRLFLWRKRPLIAPFGEPVHEILELRVRPKFHEAVRRLHGQASAKRVQEPVERGG
jgi:hypothetical protein